MKYQDDKVKIDKGEKGMFFALNKLGAYISVEGEGVGPLVLNGETISECCAVAHDTRFPRRWSVVDTETGVSFGHFLTKGRAIRHFERLQDIEWNAEQLMYFKLERLFRLGEVDRMPESITDALEEFFNRKDVGNNG